MYLFQNDPKHLFEAARRIELRQDQCLAVFLGEEDPPNLEEVVKQLNDLKIPFFGGIFPGLLFGEDQFSKGALLVPVKTLAKPEVFKNPNQGPESIPEIFRNRAVEKNNEPSLMTLIDGHFPQTGPFLKDLFHVLRPMVNYFGAEEGSLNMVSKPCLFTPDGVFQDSALVRMLLEEWTYLVDLGIGDVQMPIFEGLESTGLIRKLEPKKNCYTPIIACTAHAFSRDKNPCLTAGMNAFLAKPIDGDKCLRVLHKILSGAYPKEQKDLNHEGYGDKTLNSSSEQLVDFERLAKCTKSDKKFAAKLVGNYLNAAKNTLEKLESFHQNLEWKEIRQLAHSLKGSSLNLGASQVSKLASELEKISQIKDIDASGRLSKELTFALQQTAQSFSNYLSKEN